MSDRVFFPQHYLDLWMSDEKVTVDGEVLTVAADGAKVQLSTALRFLTEIADGGDAEQLVGKVRDLEELDALGGEHCADSVILGDNAYEVVEGFVGSPVDGSPHPVHVLQQLLAEG